MTMKHTALIGVYMLATCALHSATASSSALAGEYGVCAKAPKVEGKYTGRYAENNCQTESGGAEGKYEWIPYPGPIGTKWGYTAKARTVTLKGSGGSVVCSSWTAQGMIESINTAEERVVMSHCKLSVTSETCQSGPTAGEVLTNELHVNLIESGERGLSGKEPASGEVWSQLVGSEGPSSSQVEFECAGIPFSTFGSVSGVASGNVGVMSKRGRVNYSEADGEQDLLTTFFNPFTSKVEVGPVEELAASVSKSESRIEIKP